jgi:hypothetical protein
MPGEVQPNMDFHREVTRAALPMKTHFSAVQEGPSTSVHHPVVQVAPPVEPPHPVVREAPPVGPPLPVACETPPVEAALLEKLSRPGPQAHPQPTGVPGPAGPHLVSVVRPSLTA